MNMLKQKPRVAFVTKLWDNFYLKVGCLVSMLIPLDPRGIDLAYPIELERRSEPTIPVECKEVWRFVPFVCFESIAGGEDIS